MTIYLIAIDYDAPTLAFTNQQDAEYWADEYFKRNVPHLSSVLRDKFVNVVPCELSGTMQ